MSGTFAAANYKTLRACEIAQLYSKQHSDNMDANEVLENWSDFESEDSEIDLSSGEESGEESSVEETEVPGSSQSWREIPGL